MKGLYQHPSYTDYVAAQTRENIRKLNKIWVSDENVTVLSDYLVRKIPVPKTGLCHGTRRGVEQELFMRHLPGCLVIGTEISTTALNFPNTIKWDFHNVRPEWLRATDFIYSNALDHAYDPKKCLAAWTSCLTLQGCCFVEYSSHHGDGQPDRYDSFRAPIGDMVTFLRQWGVDDGYELVDTIDLPYATKLVSYACAFVLQSRR